MTGTAVRAAALVLTALLVLATACSSDQDVARPGSLAAVTRLDGAHFTVGGKEFPEQLVLCEITVAALESMGARIEDSCGMTGTAAVRQALLDGDIDMYWEYTGTAWTNHLHQSFPDSDPDRLYRAVQAMDAPRVTWLSPTKMSDSYAIALRRDDALRLNIQTVTDMARVVALGVPNGSICIEPEFAGRPDGWPAMRDRYRITTDQAKVQIVDRDALYPATGDGNPCLFGEVFATDGRVQQRNLVTLRDNQNSLPKYNAALTVRNEAYDPRLADAFRQIAGDLTEPTMTQLNAQVSVYGVDARSVARAWLRGRGYIT